MNCPEFNKAINEEIIVYSLNLGRYYITKNGYDIKIIFHCPFCGDKIAV